MNGKFATRVLWTGFNSGSFVATTLGISSQIGNGDGSYMPFLIGAAIAAVIQSIVMLGWPVVGQALRRRSIVLVLVMAFISISGSIFSGTFASTTYIKQVRATFLAEVHEGELVDRATEALAPVTNKALSLQRQMQAYQRFAENESFRERTSGDSCDGNQAASSCGPICRLRAAQAEEARARAGDMRSLVDRIDDLRAGAVGITQQSELVALTKASNEFLRDQTFDKVIDWAETEKSGFEGSGFEREDRVVQCRDTAAIGRLDDILDAATVLIDPALTPTLRDQTYTDVASKNVEALVGTVQTGLAGREAFVEALQSDPARQFLPLWIVSLIVETACAVLGLALIPPRGPFSNVAPEDLDVETMEIIAETYNSCAIWQGNRLYFFVPFDGDDPDLRENALLLAQTLRVTPFARRGPILIDHLMSPEEAARYREMTGASMAEAFIVRNPKQAEQKVRYGRSFTKQNRHPAE